MTSDLIDIKQVAGVHLGRTATGEQMTPYEAPKKHDASLLVPMPRSIGRKVSNITAPFDGYDVWHAYEFSFLLQSGQPQTGTLKFKFPAFSEVMIESKSFKLYLNSFDFERFNSIDVVLDTIFKEMSEIIGYFEVDYHPGYVNIFPESINLKQWSVASVDHETIREEIIFDENVEILKTKIQVGVHTRLFHTANLRSACEITNQKDTGHCFIAMKSSDQFTSHELARYIFSLRDGQHFHENVTEIIYNKLWTFFQPEELFIINVYNRRGGLDIHPARYTSEEFAQEIFPGYDNTDWMIALTNQV